MAEPVGITGTAVGIVSLGLQLYTGISDYLDAVKGRDEDLRHAKELAKTLQASLRAIDDTMKNAKYDSTVAKDAVEECKSSCETEFKALGALLKHLQGPVIAPVDRIAQAKRSLQKWTYPFNKRDIVRLENRLSSTNGVLQTALMTLQMSISNITTDAVSGLQRTAETIQTTVEKNNKTAMAQSEVLKQVSETSTRVNQEVQFISQEALVRQDARLEEICTYLQAATVPDRQIAQLVASQQDLRKVCDTMLNLLRQPEPESIVLSTRVTSFQSGRNATTQPFCRCKTRRNLRRSRSSWGPLFFETELERTDHHAPECFMSGIIPATHKKKRTLNVSIPAMQKILRSAVQISLSLTIGADGSNFSQTVVWVGTVNEYSSPAFGIIRYAMEAVGHSASVLTNEEQQILSDGTAHVFRLLAAFNVPATQAPRAGEAPFLALLTESEWLAKTNTTRETLAALAWSGESVGQDHNAGYFVFRPSRQLDLLADFPEVAEILGFNPLSLAILRADEENIQALGEKHPSYAMEGNYCGQSPVHIAIQRENFRILSLVIKVADAHALNAADNANQYPVDLAADPRRHQTNWSGRYTQACNGCKTLELLLKSGSALFQPSLRQALKRAKVIYECPDAQQTIIRHLAMKRRQLEELAVSSLSHEEVNELGLGSGRVLDRNAVKVQRYLEARSCNIPKHLMVFDGKDNTEPSEHEQSIYAYIQDRELAQYAMTLGFDTETVLVDVFRRIVQIIHQDVYPRPREYLSLPSYVCWMIERGANLASVVPEGLVLGVTQKTTYAHYLMAYLGRMGRRLYDFESALSQLVADVAIAETVTDECRCQCSVNGCTPLIKYMDESRPLWDGRHQSEDDEMQWRKELESLTTLQESHNVRYHRICGAVLRYMTFTALDLRHTCCSLWEQPMTDAEEIEEIHQEDLVRLQLLEDLVAEFETGCGSNTNLALFIRDTWIPRMREVDAELTSQKLTEEELKEAEECGVEWEHCGSEVSSMGESADSNEEFGTLEYWMRKLDEVAVDPQRPLFVA
ncbi:hypothetical protein FDECE_8017 [Fusarium decemcellulare]|nr:hypothetical protein FDECE_8017 [Fusarium decemcellulare]